MNPPRNEIRSALKATRREGGFVATLDVNEKLSILPDHFPGQPILPGICLVQAVLLAALESGGKELHVVRLKNLKLMQPIQPGQQVRIEGETKSEGNGWHVTAKIFCGGRRCANVSLIASEEEVK